MALASGMHDGDDGSLEPYKNPSPICTKTLLRKGASASSVQQNRPRNDRRAPACKEGWEKADINNGNQIDCRPIGSPQLRSWKAICLISRIFIDKHNY